MARIGGELGTRDQQEAGMAGRGGGFHSEGGQQGWISRLRSLVEDCIHDETSRSLSPCTMELGAPRGGE